MGLGEFTQPIKQQDNMACWAASLAWWLKFTPNKSADTQSDIIVRYKNLWDTGNSGGGNPSLFGGMPRAGMLQILKDSRWWMKVAELASDKLTPQTMFNMIYSSSPDCDIAFNAIILAYQRPGVGGHCVVVHDVMGDNFRYMDPAVGAHVTASVTDFNKSAVIVGGLWKFM